MSKLSELIERLCPDGVEYKRLGDIATDIYRGAGITRDQVTETGIPCVRYGEIYTTYGVWFENCVSHTQESKISNRKYFEHGDILFAITGESVDEIAKSTAYIGNDRCLAGGDIVVLKHNQNPKYLAYALSTAEAQVQKSKGKTKSKVVHSSVPAIKGIKIPVPPLEVQAEIVRILDNFAELTTELTEKLNAELIARKKQYEYYRDLLLTFDDAECPRGGDTHSRSAKLAVRWAKLGDEFPLIRNGFVGTVTPYFTDKTHGIRYLKGTNIHDGVISDNDVCYINRAFNQKHCQTILKADDILVVQSGHVGECAVVGKQYEGANCHALIVMSNGGKCDSKYISYYLQSREGKRKLKRITTGGTVKHILASQIKNVIVPVPPLSEQRRIVAILDRFDALCHDISAGLPAEIAARKKQYAYYRDKLLTFKEKVA